MAKKKDDLKAILLEEFGELTNAAFHRKLSSVPQDKHRAYIMGLVARAGYKPMSYSKAYAKVVTASSEE